jgi:hypothetical protein
MADPEDDPDQLDLENETFKEQGSRGDDEDGSDAGGRKMAIEFDLDLLGEEAEKLRNLSVLQKAGTFILAVPPQLTTSPAATHYNQDLFLAAAATRVPFHCKGVIQGSNSQVGLQNCVAHGRS